MPGKAAGPHLCLRPAGLINRWNMKKPKNTPKTTRKARDLSCSPEEMAEILAGLRTLAAAADASAEREDVRKLALRIEERLGPINGRFAMEEVGDEILRRTLDDDELPLAAVMMATMDMLLAIQLGSTPADCGEKLRTLADSLDELLGAEAGGPSPAEQSNLSDTGVTGNAGDGLDGEARVLAILVQHPEWSDTMIAKEARLSRTTLYRYPRYKAARAMGRHAGKAALPKGYKTKDGELEAYD